MNCLEFRRLALIDPLHPGQAALDHAAGCPQCARFHQALCQQEEALYRALCVPVPEGLADRVLLKRSPRLIERAWSILGPLTALAAVLVLALGIGGLLPRGLTQEALAAGVIDHVRHEPQALVADQQVPAATLTRAFARSGGDLSAPPFTASYAGRCPLPGGGEGEHLVLKTPQGKVTLILMPSKPVAAALRLFKDGLNVSVLPAGRGSLALVAETEAQVRAAEVDLLSAVRWSGRRI
jgi:hypothetical protein